MPLHINTTVQIEEPINIATSVSPESTTLVTSVSATTKHTHDDRYYTKSQIDSEIRPGAEAGATALQPSDVVANAQNPTVNITSLKIEDVVYQIHDPDLSLYRTSSAQDVIDNGILATINTHINNTNNPHNVTKAQVGLGNVDNTADINKPLSSATIAAYRVRSILLPVKDYRPMIMTILKKAMLQLIPRHAIRILISQF